MKQARGIDASVGLESLLGSTGRRDWVKEE
jgi:hypothetical protein